MPDLINRRELFKKYSYKLINADDIEELQNLFDYASGLVIKNSQMGDAYETKITAKNSNTYIKACYKQDDYSDFQRNQIKKMYNEENKYYKYLLENYEIDPLYSRMAEDYDILTSVSKYKVNGSATLEKYQEELFLKCYKKALYYWNHVTRNKSFQNEEMYRGFTEVYLIFIAIQKYITERMKNQFDVDTFNKFQCKNYFISNGVDYFDDLPIFYQKRLIKLLNDMQQNKGDDKIFDIIKNVLATNNLNIYKYILAKYQPTEEKPDGDVYFYKTPYDEELNTDTNERYTFESITEDDPYWRASKDEVLYQTFNTLDTKYISIEYTVNILKNSRIFSYFMYLLNDLMLENKRNGQNSLLNYYDASICSSKINLYDALMALFSLFLTYIKDPESENYLEDSDIIENYKDKYGNSLISGIYGYRTYINDETDNIAIKQIQHLIDKKLKELKETEIVNGIEYETNDTETIAYLNDLKKFIDTFNLKNFYYSNNYSFETIEYYYNNPKKLYINNGTDGTNNVKYEFLELCRFIKLRKIHNTLTDMQSKVNLYNLVYNDNLQEAFDYLTGLLFNGDLNIEYISIHRNLKIIYKKYLAYCIINGIIKTNNSVEYENFHPYYNNEYDIFYTFFIQNDVIFNEFLDYVHDTYGYNLPLLDDFVNHCYDEDGPLKFATFVKSCDNFFMNDNLIKYRNFYTYLDIFTTFKNELYLSNENSKLKLNTFVDLSTNYSLVDINNFMDILNENEKTRKELEDFISKCPDREIYKALYELWYNKFKSDFDYSIYENETHFKDYVLHNNESLYSYITEFGTFDDVNSLRKEIETRILNLSTSIENYISSNENFVYNSTLNVIFSRIKDYAEILIEVFKAYTLDTIYSGNILELNDKFSNKIKIYDGLDDEPIQNLILTAPPEFIDINDGIYRDDNTIDAQYILLVQNCIHNVNEVLGEDYDKRLEPFLKNIKCTIFIYEENDLPYGVSNDPTIDGIIMERYYPVVPYLPNDIVYDPNCGEVEHKGEIYTPLSTYDPDTKIATIDQSKRFWTRDYKKYNFWIPNRLWFNKCMHQAMTVLPSVDYLPDPYDVPIGETYQIGEKIYVNKDYSAYRAFSEEGNRLEYPSMVIEGNTYQTIPLEFGKRYYTFGFYNKIDLINMYFDLYNQAPFKNMCLTLTASDTGNTLVENNGKGMTKDSLRFIMKFNAHSLNEEPFTRFPYHGYIKGDKETEADILEEFEMRRAVAYIISSDHTEIWVYTGNDKSINNGFEYLGTGFIENENKIYYEPLRYYNWNGFDNQVIRIDPRNGEKIPVTTDVIDGNILEPEPHISKIEKVFHRDYTSKEKQLARIDMAGLNGSYSVKYANLDWLQDYYFTEYWSNGRCSCDDVNDERFKFKIPETINGNAYMLTYTNNISLIKKDTEITFLVTDSENLSGNINSNFAYIAVANKGITDYNDITNRPLLNEVVKLNNSQNLGFNISTINDAAEVFNSFSKINRFTGNVYKTDDDIVFKVVIKAQEHDEENIVYDDNLNYVRFKTMNPEQNEYYYDYEYANSINETEKIIESGKLNAHFSKDLFAGHILILDEENNVVYETGNGDISETSTFFNEEKIINNSQTNFEQNKIYRAIVVNTILNTGSNNGNFICNIDLDTDKSENIQIFDKNITYDTDRFGNTISCIDIKFKAIASKCKVNFKLSGLIIFETIVDYDFTEENSDSHKLLFRHPGNIRTDENQHCGSIIYYGDGTDLEYLPFMYTVHTFDTSSKKKQRVMCSTGIPLSRHFKNKIYTNTYCYSVDSYWMVSDNIEHNTTINYLNQQSSFISTLKYLIEKTDETEKTFSFKTPFKYNYDFHKDKWVEIDNTLKLEYGNNKMTVSKSDLFKDDGTYKNSPMVSIKNYSNTFAQDIILPSNIAYYNESCFYKNKTLKKFIFGPIVSYLGPRVFFNTKLESVFFLNNDNTENLHYKVENGRNIDELVNYIPYSNTALNNVKYCIIGNECFRSTQEFKNKHFKISLPVNLGSCDNFSFENSTIYQLDFSKCKYLYKLGVMAFANCYYLNRSYILNNDGTDYVDTTLNRVIYEGEYYDENNNVRNIFNSDNYQPSDGYKFSDINFVKLPYGQEKSLIRMHEGVFEGCHYVKVIDLGNTYALGYNLFNDCWRLTTVLGPEVMFCGNFGTENAASTQDIISKNKVIYKVSYNNKTYYSYHYYNSSIEYGEAVIIDGISYKIHDYGSKYIVDGLNNINSSTGEEENVYAEKLSEPLYVNNGYFSNNSVVNISKYYSYVFNNCHSLLDVEFTNKLFTIASNSFINTCYIKYNKENKCYYKLEKDNNIIKPVYIGTKQSINGDFSIKENNAIVIKEYYSFYGYNENSVISRINPVIDTRINNLEILDEETLNKTVYSDPLEIIFHGSLEEFNNVKKSINWNARSLVEKFINASVLCDNRIINPYRNLMNIPNLNIDDNFEKNNYFSLAKQDNQIYIDKIENAECIDNPESENISEYTDYTFDVYSLNDFEIINNNDSAELKKIKQNAQYSLQHFDELLQKHKNMKYKVESNEYYYKEPNRIDEIFPDRYYFDDIEDEEVKNRYRRNYFKDLTFLKFRQNKIDTSKNNSWYVTIKSKYKENSNVPYRVFIDNYSYFNMDFDNEKSTSYYTSYIYNETMEEILNEVMNETNPVFKNSIKYRIGYGLTGYDRTILNQVDKNNFNDLLQDNLLLTPSVVYNASVWEYDAATWTLLTYGLFGNDNPRGHLDGEHPNDIIFYNIESDFPKKSINDSDSNYNIIETCIPASSRNENDENHQLFLNSIFDKYEYITKYVRYDNFKQIPKYTTNIRITNEDYSEETNLKNKFSFIFKIFGIIYDNDNGELIGFKINGWEYVTINSNYKFNDEIIVAPQYYYENPDDNIEFTMNGITYRLSDIYYDLAKCTNANYHDNYYDVSSLDTLNISYSGGIRSITINTNNCIDETNQYYYCD